MWREDLHPRDEYGRFRLKGVGGVFDRAAGGLANLRHAQVIAEYEALWQKQFNYYQPLKARGELTPELDAQWDRDIEKRNALERQIPEAHHKKLVPHQDGTWRKPSSDDGAHGLYDEKGRRLPPIVATGAVRVGDSPSGAPAYAMTRNEAIDYEEHVDLVAREGRDRFEDERDISPLWGGAWHKPGEYGPGRAPILRNDMGHEISALRPDRSRSKKHRDYAGAFTRAEMRLGRYMAKDSGGDPVELEVIGMRGEFRRPSADVAAFEYLNPLNPVGRRGLARGKRKRRQRVTWIQRLNARMEGDRG